MSQKPNDRPKVGQVLVTKTARLLCVGHTTAGCKLVNLDASTEVSNHAILNGEGRVVPFDVELLTKKWKP